MMVWFAAETTLAQLKCTHTHMHILCTWLRRGSPSGIAICVPFQGLCKEHFLGIRY